jgi:hypothetical protein
MAWATVASATITTDNTSANITTRQLISSAGLSNLGYLYRVTFKAGAEGLKIGAAYIGQASDSGDAYDFINTPTQLLFSGAWNCEIAANGSIVSDQAALVLPAGKNLIISFYTSTDTTKDTTKYVATLTNWQYYYKSGNDASTVDATGYSTGVAVNGISLIESTTDIGGIQVICSD